jgi:hypothetical protein
MAGMYLFINSYASGMKVQAVIINYECNFPGRIDMANKYAHKGNFIECKWALIQLPAVM